MQKADLSNVSSSFLAEILGVTRDAVSKLHATGVIKQNGVARGKYSLFDAVPAYLDYVRANKGSDVDARLKLAQEQKIRQHVEIMENELVAIGDVKTVFGHAALLWGNAAMALPKRIAPKIAKTTSQTKIRKMLQAELDKLFPPFEKAINGFIRGKST